MRPVLKIYGMERSGTNYLAGLLSGNFDAEVFSNIGGWKHGEPVFPPHFDPQEWFLGPQDTEGLISRVSPERIAHMKRAHQHGCYFYILIVRHPASWLSSFRSFRFRQQRKRFSFSPMNEAYLYMLEKSRAMTGSKKDFYGRVPSVKQAIKEWNLMMEKYILFQQQHSDISMIIRYEDLKKSFQKQLEEIRQQYSLDNCAEAYQDIVMPLDSGDADFGQQREKRRPVIEVRLPNSNEQIQQWVDVQLLDYLGY